MAPRVALLLAACVLVASTTADDGRLLRGGRWFRQTFTKLYVDNLYVTSVVPSSCVAMEATLPPCRGLRFLNIDRIFPTSSRGIIEPTEFSLPEAPLEERRRHPDKNKHKQKPDPAIANTPEPVHLPTPQLPEPSFYDGISSSSSSWFDFIRRPTVIKTATRLVTQTVWDPSRTVTFSIKVCKPSRLPFNLPFCDGGNGLVDAAPELIVPSSAGVDLVTPTSELFISSSEKEIEQKEVAQVEIEASEAGV